MHARKHINPLKFILLLLLPPAFMHAQVPEYRFEHLSVRKGLSQGSGYSIAQDSMGYIWMGTQNGLNRFDGHQFVTIFHGLENYEGSNFITSLLSDYQGNLWVGSTAGVSVLGLSTRTFTTAPKFTGDSTLPTDLNTAKIWQDRNHNIWVIGLNNSVYRISADYKNTKRFLLTNIPGQRIADITCDSKGNIWLAASHHLLRLDRKTDSFLDVTVSKELLLTNIRTIAADQSDRIWIGTFDRGIYLHDERRRGNEKINTSSNDITSLLADKDGNMWIGTRSTGINIYTRDRKVFHAGHDAQRNSSLARNFVLSLFQDRQQNVWIGLSGEGFDKYDILNDQFGLYRKESSQSPSLADNMVLTIKAIERNKIHFGTQSAGISVLDLTSHTFQTVSNDPGNPNSLVHNTIYDIAAGRTGEVWVATWGGLCSYMTGPSGKRKFETTRPAQDGNLYTVYKMHSKDLLWVSGVNGVFLYDIQSARWVPVPGDTSSFISRQVVRVIYEDEDNNLWFGTEGSGLLRFTASDSAWATLKQGSPRENLAVTSIRSLNKEILIAGTDHGLMMINRQSMKVKKRLDVARGLPDNMIYSVEKDLKGNLWMGCNKGLIFYNADNESFKLYTESDGLQGNEFNTNCSFADTSGLLYFGGTNGVTTLNPATLMKNDYAPMVLISAIKLFDTAFLSGLALDRMKNLKLKYNQNFLAFEFAAPDFSATSRSSYSYMMEGVDKDWISSGTRRYVSYTGLRPGNYVFRVRYQNGDGVSAKNASAFSFSIEPPWWFAWWAYGVYALLVGSIAWALYRRRISQLTLKQTRQMQTMVATQESERKRLSRDLHDGVGTKLSAIKLYISSIAQQMEPDQSAQMQTLAKNSQLLIDETLAEVRKMLLNLGPEILEHFGYAVAVEGLVNKINEAKLVDFELGMFNLSNGLPPEYELALYRITQELINNVLKHAEATRVSLQVGHRDGKIILMMEDNGKGFDIYAHKDGYGLKNLEARTQLLNGTFEIDSRPGIGTNVLIEIPFQNTTAAK
ncbi:MAG: hypothetical protein H7Y27_16915 [Gemmatimonadaceae bacterium]|nr:hypothetical protein [Chitinophagaceae bacterium]